MAGQVLCRNRVSSIIRTWSIVTMLCLVAFKARIFALLFLPSAEYVAPEIGVGNTYRILGTVTRPDMA